MGWWGDIPDERYWLEATDRDDIGTDLRAPLSDSGGRTNWRYALFRDANPGDVVFHYDGNAAAITSRSVIAGPPFEQPITWAARGSYARERGAVPVEVPGYAMPLRDHRKLTKPVTLASLRADRIALDEIEKSLRKSHPGKPLYFPFELSNRPVRPMQGYAFKLPAAFVRHFQMDPASPETPELTISRDRRRVTRLFRVWREAILEDATRGNGLWEQPVERFFFRNQDERASRHLGPRTALGIDPTGKDWAVQINEAKNPGDLDITSAIAFDPAGRPFLIRQGRLAANAVSQKPILYEEFARLTGLRSAKVANGDSRISRDWYVVTPLDVPADGIRARTGQFVDACAAARRAAGDGVSDPSGNSIELGSEDERGGLFSSPARPALPERQLRRLQGEVWVAMARVLRKAGLYVGKPRHAAGYEVDAEIVGGGHEFLVEIKSAAGAADVHTGVGQLLLYQALIPRLAQHRRILLLPALPKDALVQAIERYEITVCTYRLTRKARSVKVDFSTEFLDLFAAGVAE